MKILLAIALGSALGGVLRYLTGALVHLWFARSFPWGTLGVNVIGCALIGVSWVLLATRGEDGELARAFVLVGLLGGFTTFSSFFARDTAAHRAAWLCARGGVRRRQRDGVPGGRLGGNAVRSPLAGMTGQEN